jgi:predicted small lipoprotein YifL
LSLFRDPPLYRLALVGVALTALTLAGCGRKGPLDPPPGASMASAPPAAATPVGEADPLAATLGQQLDGRPAQRPTPAGPNRGIFLDNLLN